MGKEDKLLSEIKYKYMPFIITLLSAFHTISQQQMLNQLLEFKRATFLKV
jgi:hypothetical protein